MAGHIAGADGVHELDEHGAVAADEQRAERLVPALPRRACQLDASPKVGDVVNVHDLERISGLWVDQGLEIVDGGERTAGSAAFAGDLRGSVAVPRVAEDLADGVGDAGRRVRADSEVDAGAETCDSPGVEVLVWP